MHASSAASHVERGRGGKETMNGSTVLYARSSGG